MWPLQSASLIEMWLSRRTFGGSLVVLTCWELRNLRYTRKNYASGLQIRLKQTYGLGQLLLPVTTNAWVYAKNATMSQTLNGIHPALGL
jgi:hypothetical protein